MYDQLVTLEYFRFKDDASLRHSWKSFIEFDWRGLFRLRFFFFPLFFPVVLLTEKNVFFILFDFMAKWLHAAQQRGNCKSINMQFLFRFFCVFCCFIDGELVKRWMSYISIASNICQTDRHFRVFQKIISSFCFRHLHQLRHLLV